MEHVFLGFLVGGTALYLGQGKLTALMATAAIVGSTVLLQRLNKPERVDLSRCNLKKTTELHLRQGMGGVPAGKFGDESEASIADFDFTLGDTVDLEHLFKVSICCQGEQKGHLMSAQALVTFPSPVRKTRQTFTHTLLTLKVGQLSSFSQTHSTFWETRPRRLCTKRSENLLSEYLLCQWKRWALDTLDVMVLGLWSTHRSFNVTTLPLRVVVCAVHKETGKPNREGYLLKSPFRDEHGALRFDSCQSARGSSIKCCEPLRA